MIVMCEGCETSFQVEDRLIKSTGSKVRCSKCRLVFVAYAPAADPASEEPLILSDEMPATQTPRVQAEMSEMGSRIDAIFADDLAVADETSDDQEPELLDVNELLMEDAPPAFALTAGSLEGDLKLDVGFGLNLVDEPVDQGVSAVASPGGKDYGPLSIFAQSFLDLSIKFSIKPSAFFPPPKVESAVIHMVWKERPLVKLEEEGWFKKVVKGSFSYRRKKLINALRHADLPLPEDLEQRVRKIGIEPQRRPETLTIQEFVRLADALRS